MAPKTNKRKKNFRRIEVFPRNLDNELSLPHGGTDRSVRKKFSAEFEAEVALAALTSDKTMGGTLL